MTGRQVNALFLALALGLLALMAAQVQQSAEGTVLGHAARAVTSPVVTSVSWLSRTVSRVFHGYLYFVGVEKERSRLVRRVARMEAEQARIGEVYRENRRLRSLLGLRSSAAFPRGVFARVATYLDSGPARQAILVNRGRRHGVEPGWVALSHGAVVGRVVDSAGSTAEVLLVIDPDSGTAVRHVDGRFAGVLRGGNHGPAALLPLEYVPRDVPVAVGDTLVTSGLDLVYPPGLLIGHIRELAADSPLTWTIWVQVAFEPAELEELLLIPPFGGEPPSVPVTHGAPVDAPALGAEPPAETDEEGAP